MAVIFLILGYFVGLFTNKIYHRMFPDGYLIFMEDEHEIHMILNYEIDISSNNKIYHLVSKKEEIE